MAEQEANAVNGDVEQDIADAEALLRGMEEGEVSEEVNEEPVTEQEESDEAPPEPPKEDDDHSEKSRLGRKLKRLEQEQRRRDEELRNELSEIKNFLSRSARQDVDPEDVEPPLSEYPTAEEILARERWHNRQIEKKLYAKEQAAQIAQAQYQKKYLELLSDIDPEEEPELYALLTDEKDTTYNQAPNGYYGDPAVDFARNLAGATKALLSRAKEKKPNVKGKSGTVATGIDTTTTTKTKTFDREPIMKNLSKDERALAKMLSDEEFKRIFG